MRFETKQWQAGKTWKPWNYPHHFNSSSGFSVPNRCEVQAMYIKDNWRAFRTWGLSAPSGWSYDRFFVIRPDFEATDERPRVDWEKLQKPGYSVDFVRGRARMKDWVPNAVGKAFTSNNRPLLAYIGGKPERFSSKGHNFNPGDTVSKQIIIINNSRQLARARYSWTFKGANGSGASGTLTVETGKQKRIPISFKLSPDIKPGQYDMVLTVGFDNGDNGEIRADTFAIHVVPEPPAVKGGIRTALFDPKGETAKLLKDMGVQCDVVGANADLGRYDVLIVGKAALTLDGPAPDISRVRDGLKVIMFEQTADVLEKRFGFRVQQYGLRRVFARVPDHPLLAGLNNDNLRDWQGQATILPPRLKHTLWPGRGAAVVRSGIKVPRAYRCGNWGNVASVLIEKPARGDFLPITDGGFALQYSPLMVYREGSGMLLLCQMDVTGRSENDPAAERLVSNILNYVSAWKPTPTRKALYVGDPAGLQHLKNAGITAGTYTGGKLTAEEVLIVGAGAGKKLAAHKTAISAWLNADGRLLSLALSGDEFNVFGPFKVTTKRAEHINAVFKPAGHESLIAGVGPADVHNRDPHNLNLVISGANPIGNGVLAVDKDNRVVFCQIVPWRFDYKLYYNMKQTYRRTSFLLTRLLANMGCGSETPVLGRFSSPVTDGEKRWLVGFYLEEPIRHDDPYRFFRW